MAGKKHVFGRLNTPPAYKVVADELQRAVMRRDLRPGDALPIESELAEQFGVNRSTLREGIRHLEQTGLVERHGKKLIVSRPTYGRVGDQVSQALVVHDVTFEELWQVKMSLEPLAASLAARHATEEDLARLSENIEATRSALEAGENPISLDVEFHTLIAEASRNTALLIAREAVARLFYPAYKVGMFPEASGRRLLEAHMRIFDAIRNGDEEVAAEWMRRHIVDFKRGYQMAGLNIEAPVPYE